MAVKTAFPGVGLVQDTIRTVQAETQKIIDRARKEANGLVGKSQRKALNQLLSQAKGIRTDIQKRTTKAIKTIESRAGAVFARIEGEMKKRLDPIADKFSWPSKRDIELLAKRLSSLEKKVNELLASKSARA